MEDVPEAHEGSSGIKQLPQHDKPEEIDLADEVLFNRFSPMKSNKPPRKEVREGRANINIFAQEAYN
jgi:hypothetical protein